MTIMAQPFISLLELLYPERCLLCGTGFGETEWSARGPRVPGMHFWHATHLCHCCAASIPRRLVSGEVGLGHPGCLKVMAASNTNPDLVKLVGQFKYHGVRGVAWPLARLLVSVLDAARQHLGEVDFLVPVPLHASRRRARGFNQAELLARLLIKGTNLELDTRILTRHRKTGQQAKIVSVEERMNNLAESFRARPHIDPGTMKRGRGARIGLIDDLVTSGWTCVSAAAKLRGAGWDVKWALGLGLAAHPKKEGTRVDTWDAGF